MLVHFLLIDEQIINVRFVRYDLVHHITHRVKVLDRHDLAQEEILFDVVACNRILFTFYSVYFLSDSRKAGFAQNVQFVELPLNVVHFQLLFFSIKNTFLVQVCEGTLQSLFYTMQLDLGHLQIFDVALNRYKLLIDVLFHFEGDVLGFKTDVAGK